MKANPIRGSTPVSQSVAARRVQPTPDSPGAPRAVVQPHPGRRVLDGGGLLRAGMAAVISLKPDLQSHYVSCDGHRGFHIVGAAGADFSASVEIAAAIAIDLINAPPLGLSRAQYDEFREAVKLYAAQVARRFSNFQRFTLSVPDFYAVCREVGALRGASTAAVVAATEAIRNGGGLGRAVPIAGSATRLSPEGERGARAWVVKADAIKVICGSMIDGLVCSTRMGRVDIAHTALDVAPLAANEIDRLFDTLGAGQSAQAGCVRLFDALKLDHTGSIAAQVLPRMEALVQQNTLDPRRDLVGGIWVPATAVVLCLSEPVLGKMFLTSEMVSKLAQMKPLVLGHLWNARRPGRMHPAYREVVERDDPVLADLVPVLRRLDCELRAAAPQSGKDLAAHFDRAVDILARNARRLEFFADMPAASDPVNTGRRIADLLQEFVPESADAGLLQPTPMAPSTLAAPAGTEHDTETDTPTDVDVGVDIDAVPAEVKGSAPEIVNIHLRHASELGAQTGPQPGARRGNPAEHHHPAEQKGLKKEEVKARKAKQQLVVQGLLDPFAVFTPKLHAELLDKKREARLLRNLGSTDVVGGRLIQPAFH